MFQNSRALLLSKGHCLGFCRFCGGNEECCLRVCTAGSSLQAVLLQTRQPWADIVAEPARPTAEQEEWLKAEGFREEPAEEEPDQDAEDGPPKVA